MWKDFLVRCTFLGALGMALGLGSLAGASDIPKRETFSLKRVLQDLGYNPQGPSAYIIENEEDFREALDAGHYQWPFKDIGVSPSLSAVAVSLDLNNFAALSRIDKQVAVLEIPNKADGAVRISHSLSVPDGKVFSVDFLSESVLRVGVSRSTGPDPLHLGSRDSYRIYSLGNGGLIKDVESRFPTTIKNIIQVRHLSDSLYLVLEDPTRKNNPDHLILNVVRYDVMEKQSKVLEQFSGNPELIRALLMASKGKFGKIWNLGVGGTQLLFSSLDRETSQWKSLRLNIQGSTAAIEETNSDVDIAKHMIQNSERYYRVDSEEGLMIVDQFEEGIVVNNKLVLSQQDLRKVTKGFVGELNEVPQSWIYLYKFDGTFNTLSDESYGNVDHRDGGFVGITETTSNKKDLHLSRVIYDAESLANVETQNESVQDCVSALLAKVARKKTK